MKREEKLTTKVYTKNVLKEWKRLVKNPYHRLEFETTLHFLKKYLPKKALILDAGGGPGRYTIELAKRGYDVTLLDFVPANLQFALKKIRKAKVQKRIKGVVEGSITNLSMFKDNTFDAVICLGGPLSHVHPESEREKAISELIRVTKKNAPIFVSVMAKFVTLMRGPGNYAHEIKMTKHFKKFAFEGDDYHFWKGQAFCHFFVLDEFKKLFDNKKVKVLEIVGLEGISSPDQKGTNKLYKDKKSWKNWMEVHYKLCTHPTVVDTSQHMMIIVRKC